MSLDSTDQRTGHPQHNCVTVIALLSGRARSCQRLHYCAQRQAGRRWPDDAADTAPCRAAHARAGYARRSPAR